MLGPKGSANPLSRSLSTDLDLDLGATTFENEGEPEPASPTVRARTFEAEDGAGTGGSAAGQLLLFDDSMLQDLVFAFEACDIDGNGYLDAHELLAVIRVLGGAARAQTLDIEIMRRLIQQEWEELKRRESSGSRRTSSRSKATSSGGRQLGRRRRGARASPLPVTQG
jgi:hypothetical protein